MVIFWHILYAIKNYDQGGKAQLDGKILLSLQDSLCT